jgi:ABC-type glycerol-3-phosphate transport system substrate-binding protein
LKFQIFKTLCGSVDFLAPLEGLVGADELEDFVPLILELASVGGLLYGVPRNIDVRLLHYRADLVRRPPATWDALLEEARAQNAPPGLYGFVFPGRESGLFGTFYELAEMAGARLFPETLVPDIENGGARALGATATPSAATSRRRATRACACCAIKSCSTSSSARSQGWRVQSSRRVW